MTLSPGSNASGHALYEWGAPDRSHHTDFALWMESVGRFAIEVKGGQYTLDGVQWFLGAPDGLEAKSSPLQQADDAAMDLRNEIRRQTGYKVFIIPVVVFPDMQPDPVIEQHAARTNVKVVWGTKHLLADLEAVARRIVVDHPPRASYIVNEVQAVTVGADAGADRATDSGQPRTEARRGAGGGAAGVGRSPHHHPPRGAVDRAASPRLRVLTSAPLCRPNGQRYGLPAGFLESSPAAISVTSPAATAAAMA